MRSYAKVAAVRKELAPGGPSYNPGAVGYTSSFQEDFCNLGKTQRPSVRPGEAGYKFQEDPGFYREFAPGQQVVVYYPDPPPGVSPRHHVFWQPFTVVEMVGRVTVKVSQQNRKAIMVKVDRVVQESHKDTGYGAVGCEFKADSSSHGDSRSRAESQRNEATYQGRNLYGIEEFKWGRSEKKKWRQPGQVGSRDLKDQHKGETVTGRDGACRNQARPAAHPQDKKVRAYWKVLDDDFEAFKLGVTKNREAAAEGRKKRDNPARLVSTCVGDGDWEFVGNQGEDSSYRNWIHRGKDGSQEDIGAGTVVDHGWVYHDKNLNQETAEVEDEEVPLTECPPSRVEPASWDVLSDDWIRDA
jgi:hypothetical protein